MYFSFSSVINYLWNETYELFNYVFSLPRGWDVDIIWFVCMYAYIFSFFFASLNAYLYFFAYIKRIPLSVWLYSYFRVWTTLPLSDTSTETWPHETFWWRARWGWKSVILAWPRCCRRTKSTTLSESRGKAPSFGEEHTACVYWQLKKYFHISVGWLECFD